MSENLPNDVADIFNNPKDVERLRNIAETILQSDEPDVVAAFILPTVLAIALKFVQPSDRVSREVIKPADTANTIAKGIEYYLAPIVADSYDEGSSEPMMDSAMCVAKAAGLVEFAALRYFSDPEPVTIAAREMGAMVKDHLIKSTITN